jgi:hypothetical protein
MKGLLSVFVTEHLFGSKRLFDEIDKVEFAI